MNMLYYTRYINGLF